MMPTHLAAAVTDHHIMRPSESTLYHERGLHGVSGGEKASVGDFSL